MKHVFFIGSHITFYSALSVQKYLKIKPENVIYITYRSYRNIFHKSINFFQIEKIVRKKSIGKFRQHCNSTLFKFYYRFIFLLNMNSFIEKEIHDNFFLYTFLLRPEMKMFHLHSFCRKTFFIEEGTISLKKHEYFKKGALKKILTDKYKVLNMLSWSNDNQFIKADGYCFHEQAFAGISCVRPIVIPMYREPSLHKYVSLPPDKSCIIISGNELKLLKKKEGEHIKKLLQLWEKIFLFSSMHKNIYIKFHPEEKISTSSLRTEKLELLNKLNIKFNIIPSDVPLEQIFLQKKKYYIIGLVSSALMYAGILNKYHEVVSFQSCLDESIISERVNSEFKEIEKYFFKYVKDYSLIANKKLANKKP